MGQRTRKGKERNKERTVFSPSTKGSKIPDTPRKLEPRTSKNKFDRERPVQDSTELLKNGGCTEYKWVHQRPFRAIGRRRRRMEVVLRRFLGKKECVRFRMEVLTGELFFGFLLRYQFQSSVVIFTEKYPCHYSTK